MQQQSFLIAVTKCLFILFTRRTRQYKCIITISICLLLIPGFALYIFIGFGELFCVHYVETVNTIFFQKNYNVLWFSRLFPFSHLDKREDMTGREWVKFKTSLIPHDREESIQFFYLYLSACVLGVLVLLTTWTSVIFLFQSINWET